MGVFSKLDGVKIAGLCDPDSGKVSAAKERYGADAKGFSDLRAMIDDKQIDAVVIAGNSGGTLHQKIFLEAVRKRDRTLLNTDVQVGQDSTGWCNLANIAYRTGKAFSMEIAQHLDVNEWKSLVGEMKELMAAHSLTMENAGLKIGPMLTVDPKTEQFVGSDSEQANRFLKREYRAPFIVPEDV